MATFVFVFLLFLLSTLLMAWGVIHGRAPIRGSCGGAGAALGEDSVCKVCQGDMSKCPTDNKDG